MFVSAEDRLLTNYAPLLAARIAAIPSSATPTRDDLRHFSRAQRQAEQQAAAERRVLLTQDGWRSELTEALIS
jgi:hypothetical protein